LVDKFPDLSGKDDVYSSHQEHRRVAPTIFKLDILSDGTPCALGRLFGLFTTINIVPDRVGSDKKTNGEITTSVSVSTTDATAIDLLVRKIAQLTETIAIQVDT